MRVKNNNKGYSLVELLIAMFILGIVMIGIVMIMRTTSISYRDGNAEITAQTEAQIVANQIEELLVDTSTSYGEGVYNSKTYYMVVNGDVKHLLLYDHTNNTIQYKKCAKDAAITNDGWSLMAEYVSAFDISGFSKTVTDPDCDNKVTVNITMETAEGYSYSATKEVYFRNAIENANVQKINNGVNDSSASEENVIYVNLKRYDIIDLKTEYGIDINAPTTTVSDDFSDYYDFVSVTWNSSNTNKKLSDAITKVEAVAVGTKTDYVRTNTTLLNSLDDVIVSEPTSKYYITGVGFDNKKVKLIFYTEAVSFNIATVSGEANAGGYAGIKTMDGDHEKYIGYVEVNGIDLGMMLNTTDLQITYAMVAYQDGTGENADQKYKTTGDVDWTNAPKVGRIRETGYNNSDSLGGRLNDSPVLLLRMVVDAESGDLALQQDEKADATNAPAFATGNKRVAVLMYIPTTSALDTEKSYPVLDLNLYMQGGTLEHHTGGNQYTASFKSWGINTL